MKTLCLWLLAAAHLVAGCGQSHDALSAADLSLISATYGSGTSFAEVTERVNDLLRRPGGECFAQPLSLGTDPSPGWNKTLVIVYEFKHRRCLFTAGEGEKVNVPALLAKAGH